MINENILDLYKTIVGQDEINHLVRLASKLNKLKVLHINSTKTGGGVAEILEKLVPLKNSLGIETQWEIITGDLEFYKCTKKFHNSLQGSSVFFSDLEKKIFEETNKGNAERLRTKIENADIVFIHDPQPAALIDYFPERKNKWIWRCHIDVSKPQRDIWRYLKQFITKYDASIFSLPDFAQPLPHPQYIIPPSIDPLSEKNMQLDQAEIDATRGMFKLDVNTPIILQVSRFDKFKDPIGVIQAYQLIKKEIPVQLVLAGGSATDDPEGEAVLAEVKEVAKEDPDIHILLLPPDAHRVINALQRLSDIIIQKSLKEGFGLTVTEGMWKKKPVIGGDTGGIRIQIQNHITGFKVSTPQGAALRIRYLLQNQKTLNEMGEKAKESVRENFLITRHLRNYMTLILFLINGNKEKLNL